MYAFPAPDVHEPRDEKERQRSALMGLLLHRFNNGIDREIEWLLLCKKQINEYHKNELLGLFYSPPPEEDSEQDSE